ncbi:hypothetical protein [Pantoea sp. CTOTU46764]|uniref:hypothetical protein n=1 Tax=Pantoea TaxID=53335 RepID=UPI00289E535D|nr:hypothetical protein [Pantoea sp. CTOTU46764]
MLSKKLLQRACQLFSSADYLKKYKFNHQVINPRVAWFADVVQKSSPSVLRIATVQKPTRYNTATLSLGHEVINAGKSIRVCR